MDKKKVIILGGGIGGLTAAHELSKYPDIFDVTIIERNKHLGGQAAETIDKHTSRHTALCWHAISSYYTYFLNVMDEIIGTDELKVISHLKPVNNFIYAMDGANYNEKNNSFVTRGLREFRYGFKQLYKKDIPLNDLIKLCIIHLRAQTMCEEKMKEYDAILWKDYISDLSPEVKRWVLDSTSIYLGMDYNKLSTHFMFNIMRNKNKSSKLDPQYTFYSFDGSMYDVLFKPWKHFLENRGVTFLLEHEVSKIYHIGNLTTISSIDVIAHGGVKEVHTANIFINAMDTKNLSALYPEILTSKSDFDQLHENSKQLQMHVLYYLPYRLQPIGSDSTVVILPDSPWFLMIRIEGTLWELKTNDLLSCGIGMFDVLGLNGKCASMCTREEIAQECWNQICNSQHNLKLKSKMPEWNIWDSYKFDEHELRLTTYEPKFSNNINTLRFRPDIIDKHIHNLYHATAYVKTQTNVYNMESAAEAGIECVKSILLKSNIIQSGEKKKKEKHHIMIRFARFLSRIKFKIKKFFQKN